MPGLTILLNNSVTKPATLLEEANPNVILYLPPGPLFSPRRLGNSTNDNPYNGEDSDKLSGGGYESLPSLHDLAVTTCSTVVTVNYRLGGISPVDDEPGVELNSEQNEGHNSENQGTVTQEKARPFYTYPTPIHDTLTGFDYVLQNLQPAQISVVGMHIGGSLALMLSLTESKLLHAVAALEPVCDWVELDEYCMIPPESENESDHNSTPKKSKAVRYIAPPDLVPLLQAREDFFLASDRYFDAFASPILFLRSSGTYVPQKLPEYLTGPDYPIPVRKKQPKDEEDANEFWDVYSSSGADMDVDALPDPADIRKGMRRRKSLSRWPPFGLDYGLDGAPPTKEGIGRLEMALPWVRVYTRETADELPSISHDRPRYARNFPPRRVLEWQADEMVSVMRRACFWGRETGFADERVTLATTEKDKWMQDTGKWLEGLLEAPTDR